ncbi:uncharacterized protein LOC144129348 isoform X1 [Amblyomma americanum]
MTGKSAAACAHLNSSSCAPDLCSGGYSVRIRDSNTPGRKVGLWGCDFCAFTHVNVAKVQAHVQEHHLAALKRTWEMAALWQGSESQDAQCSGGEGSADSCALGQQQQTARRQPFRFPPMAQFAAPEDNGGSSVLEPIVICKVDDDEEDQDCLHRTGTSF